MAKINVNLKIQDDVLKLGLLLDKKKMLLIEIPIFWKLLVNTTQTLLDLVSLQTEVGFVGKSCEILNTAR